MIVSQCFPLVTIDNDRGVVDALAFKLLVTRSLNPAYNCRKSECSKPAIPRLRERPITKKEERRNVHECNFWNGIGIELVNLYFQQMSPHGDDQRGIE